VIFGAQEPYMEAIDRNLGSSTGCCAPNAAVAAAESPLFTSEDNHLGQVRGLMLNRLKCSGPERLLRAAFAPQASRVAASSARAVRRAAHDELLSNNGASGKGRLEQARLQCRACRLGDRRKAEVPGFRLDAR